MARGSDSTTSSTRTFMPSPSKDEKPAKQRRPLPKLKLRIKRRTLPWLVILALALFSVFMVAQYHEARSKLRDSANATSAQTTSTVKKVGKLIMLPTDEQPTIITVKDASKLKGQAFYADAKDGDITLVYAKAQKAILYRPSQNIIVNVAPVTVSNSTAQ